MTWLPLAPRFKQRYASLSSAAGKTALGVQKSGCEFARTQGFSITIARRQTYLHFAADLCWKNRLPNFNSY